MKRATWLCACGALLLSMSQAFGGSQVNLRLVEAGKKGADASGGLGDVAGLLRENTPYSSFRMLASQSFSLPAGGSATMAGGFRVTCSGPQSRLRVSVERGGRNVLETTVELQDGTPLVVGGFPSAGGKVLVVLVVR